MNVFTEVYEKSIDLLKTPALDSSWKEIETDLKQMLEADGPSDARAQVLEDLRGALAEAAKGKAVAVDAMADEIVKAAKVGANGYQDRAALIKAMQHFYFVQKKGSQSIWVVDSPKAYGKWTYDEFSGKDEVQLKTALRGGEEVFGSSNRSMMSDALQLARKWSADIEVKLSGADKSTLEKVARWFHEDGAKEEDVKASAEKLHGGFKKIHATCNSTKVLFSDRPHLRASGAWDNVYASVNALDVMPVLYIFQLFLKTGRKNRSGQIPKMWLCALTVLHELSHKLVGTDDVRYDDDGLKPGPNFPSDKAIANADSWAYFAADAVGALSKGTVESVLK